MDQKKFDELLQKYLKGDVSEEELELIDRWYQAIEHKPSGATEAEKAEIEGRLRLALQTHKENGGVNDRGTKSGQQVMLWSPLSLRIAASLAVLVVLAGVFLLAPSPGNRADLVVDRNGWKEIENTSLYAHLVALEDGSEITLEAGAVLEYRVPFDPLMRDVRLRKGSAFFNIRRDEKRPFYVYSHDVVTRVLGTSFMINAGQKGHVTIDVKTGSVSVSARLPATRDVAAPEIILKPNQRAAYDPTRKKIARAYDQPEMAVPSEVRDMTFDRASIATIFRALEKAYQVKIEFDEQKFYSCKLTTYVITTDDLDTRLKVICEAIGAAYRVEGGRVVIEGKGC